MEILVWVVVAAVVVYIFIGVFLQRAEGRRYDYTKARYYTCSSFLFRDRVGMVAFWLPIFVWNVCVNDVFPALVRFARWVFVGAEKREVKE
ncbi:MAG: hypothetical protein ABIJ36_00100 [Patescibacteria group bacterium]|nr:hypothetical protein [Patescibacteria group bacterium]